MSPLRLLVLIVAHFGLVAGCGSKPPATPSPEEAAKAQPLDPPQGETNSLNDSVPR